MTAPFSPGDLVKCIDDDPASGRSPHGRFFHLYPVKGRIYTIRDCFPVKDWFATRLEELRLEPVQTNRGLSEPAFIHTRFVPVDRNKFTHLLTIKEPIDT